MHRLAPPPPDHDVIYSVAEPFKDTGGLRLLRGNLAPDGGAILKVAGVEGGVQDGVFTGRARVFNSERSADRGSGRTTRTTFDDNDMVVIRYEGPRGAPGNARDARPDLADHESVPPTNITIALMTDARFSGGSVGLVIGHVAPEAFLGGPIALVKDGDTIVVDIEENRIDCLQLDDAETYDQRSAAWRAAVGSNRDVHPDAVPVAHRVLRRMRATALPALLGGGMASD